jgi:hypothetical protein
MSLFGAQKTNIFGTYGEFSVGAPDRRVRAQFLLTKIRPGSEGAWENELAAQMVPWREVFNAEEMTFDELLQRDLDDSRVANDLIPYLLGEKGAFARFFPPILAVIVPRNPNKSGIVNYYPEPTAKDSSKLSYGDLFDFSVYQVEGQASPLGVLSYTRQKTAFVIVDGQHRAMAVLALHRQLTQSWGSTPFASYYQHLMVTAEDVKQIELPVCVVFFPDIHDSSEDFKSRGIDLRMVCREIFLVVNRNAKEVSKSRELLLDDDDFAARMMRRTLSKLKGRGEDNSNLARIYSFAYGDADFDTGKQVVFGQLEYCSAFALYKLHSAAAFAMPGAFNFKNADDITDLKKVRHPARPMQLLKGTSVDKWKTLSKRAGRSHPPEDVEQITGLLGDLTDEIIVTLFDSFRPFAIHNAELRYLRTHFQDPTVRADLIQAKCSSLLFEGSGVRTVFEDHQKRLEARKEELLEEAKEPGDYLKNQSAFCSSVKAAMQKHEEDLKRSRGCQFFNIDKNAFFSNPDVTEEAKHQLRERYRSIFDTISTQAFQLGFLMSVLTLAERMLQGSAPSYLQRLRTVQFITKLYISSLNHFFSPSSDTKHRTLSGFVTESRASIFSTKEPGLRGLLGMSVKELNERQWEFFRYAILEIVHSKHCLSHLSIELNNSEAPDLVQRYHDVLPSILDDVEEVRNRYISAAESSALNSSAFQGDLNLRRLKLLAEGAEPSRVDVELSELCENERKRVRDVAKGHIKASLGGILKRNKVLSILGLLDSPDEPVAEDHTPLHSEGTEGVINSA